MPSLAPKLLSHSSLELYHKRGTWSKLETGVELGRRPNRRYLHLITEVRDDMTKSEKG
jgi:hypothetical protein